MAECRCRLDDVSKGIRVFRERRNPKDPSYINFAVEDYARLLNNAACLIGNSSSALREGAFLGVPASISARASAIASTDRT